MALAVPVRFVWLACMAGCGRLGFETTHDAAPATDGNGDASSDARDAAPGVLGLVQTGAVGTGTNGLTLTLPAPSTAGTLLVAAIGTNGVNALGLPAPWLPVGQIGSSGGCFAALAYLPDNPGNVTSVTFMQGAGIPGVGLLAEWSGVAATSPIDATGMAMSNNPTGSQSVQTTTMTAVASELAVDIFCEDVNSPTYTPGAGWTNLGTFSNTSSAPSVTSDFQIVAAPGTVGETVTSSVNGKYGAIVATFRP